MRNNSRIQELNSLTIKKLLTIIIPTKNRPYMLNRSLYYYAKMKFLARIIVIDSSGNALLSKTKEICKKYSDDLYIDYIEVDENSEVSEKHYIGANMVSTPYILSVGDDDFPIISSLKDIIFRLEKDKSIVAAFGQRVAIKQDSGKSPSLKYVKTYPNYGGISIANEIAIDRIRRLPIPIWQQYPNAICRTNTYRDAYKIVRKLEHTQYAEFFTLSYILSHGKWIKYDILFAVCHQESKFCEFKDRYLFPSYIGSGGSVLDGMSQDSWSKTVSLLCKKVAVEFVGPSLNKIEDMSLMIRHIYYSKLFNYIEYSSGLSNNLIDNNSNYLRVVNSVMIRFGKLYWKLVLYDKSGGIYEFIKFFFGLLKEIVNGRLFRLALKSKTNTSIKSLLVSIKRTGSLDYETDSLLNKSSKYFNEYKIIFDIWTKNPCPQKIKK